MPEVTWDAIQEIIDMIGPAADFKGKFHKSLMEMLVTKMQAMEEALGGVSTERTSLKAIVLIGRNSLGEYISETAYSEFDGDITVAFATDATAFVNFPTSDLSGKLIPTSLVQCEQLFSLIRNVETDRITIQFYTLSGGSYTSGLIGNPDNLYNKAVVLCVEFFIDPER